MSILVETPLDRARAKRDRIERDLKKCPDFQLYLIARSREDRARMERLLIEIPTFRLWRTLTTCIERVAGAAKPETRKSTHLIGLHRLEAAKALGEETILCFLVDSPKH